MVFIIKTTTIDDNYIRIKLSIQKISHRWIVIHPSFINISIYPSIHSTNQPTKQLPNHSSIQPSIHSTIHTSINPYILKSSSKSTIHPFNHTYIKRSSKSTIHPFNHPTVYPFNHSIYIYISPITNLFYFSQYKSQYCYLLIHSLKLILSMYLF